MAKQEYALKGVRYGVSGVKSDKVKVKDKRGYTYEYRCYVNAHNYRDVGYYTVAYETGMSWNGGIGKEYKRYKTKAEALKGLTAFKKKLRASGHPFRG